MEDKSLKDRNNSLPKVTQRNIAIAVLIVSAIGLAAKYLFY